MLGHYVWTYVTGMVNSMMSVNQYKANLLKTVQVFLNVIVHRQVCVEPIHNWVPKLDFHIII